MINTGIYKYIFFEPEVLDHIPEGVPVDIERRPFAKADSCGRTLLAPADLDFEMGRHRQRCPTTGRRSAGVLLGDRFARCRSPDGKCGLESTWR